MDIEQTLSIVQIVLAVILVASILLQSRGAGLSTAFGGEGNVYRTKRGFEKTLFIATIIISVLFFSVAMANILIRQ